MVQFERFIRAVQTIIKYAAGQPAQKLSFHKLNVVFKTILNWGMK